ncbi:MAG: hypothetical protein CL960_02255 [Euryarchaeota archaeon]|nr:hypothetical protein [Euryarchaeota archaeon]
MAELLIAEQTSAKSVDTIRSRMFTPLHCREVNRVFHSKEVAASILAMKPLTPPHIHRPLHHLINSRSWQGSSFRLVTARYHITVATGGWSGQHIWGLSFLALFLAPRSLRQG